MLANIADNKTALPILIRCNVIALRETIVVQNDTLVLLYRRH